MTDPTVSGPILPETDARSLTVSLAEVDAMAKKATRGAGFSWGMAEEAGFACRWLAAHGLPGPETLLRVLSEAPPTARCPLTRGTSIADRAQALLDGEALRVSDVYAPLLVLPFVAQIARRHDCCLRLGDVFVTPRGIDAANVNTLIDADIGLVEVASVKPQSVDGMRTASPNGVSVSATVWAGLDRFAHRTYVPATAESRASGAGAGLTDND